MHADRHNAVIRLNPRWQRAERRCVAKQPIRWRARTVLCRQRQVKHDPMPTAATFLNVIVAEQSSRRVVSSLPAPDPSSSACQSPESAANCLHHFDVPALAQERCSHSLQRKDDLCTCRHQFAVIRLHVIDQERARSRSERLQRFRCPLDQKERAHHRQT